MEPIALAYEMRLGSLDFFSLDEWGKSEGEREESNFSLQVIEKMRLDFSQICTTTGQEAVITNCTKGNYNSIYGKNLHSKSG